MTREEQAWAVVAEVSKPLFAKYAEEAVGAELTDAGDDASRLARAKARALKDVLIQLELAIKGTKK